MSFSARDSTDFPASSLHPRIVGERAREGAIDPPPHEPGGPHELREGLLVGEKYRLVALAGAGAMGEVWRARHATLGHGVAIKFLLGHARDSEEARVRFEREARIAAQLGEASPHVARVLDCGRLADETPFLVMELLRGEELAARTKREGRLPLELVARIVRQLCRALSVAHAAGVVHRDVKPANVFLCSTNDPARLHVKLMDFGVAKAMDGEIDMTRAGTIIGTPAYMSPEQVMAKPVDARSDLWSVAATVYRLVTGATPFGTGAYAELGVRIVSSPPMRATSLVNDLPRAFDAFIDKGLAKDPNARFQSATELADALAIVAGLHDDVEPMPLTARAPRSARHLAAMRALKEAPTLSPPVAESASAISLERTSPSRYGGRSGVRRSGRSPRTRAPAIIAFVAMLGALVFLRTHHVVVPIFATSRADADAAPPALDVVVASTTNGAISNDTIAPFFQPIVTSAAPSVAPSTSSSSSAKRFAAPAHPAGWKREPRPY